MLFSIVTAPIYISTNIQQLKNSFSSTPSLAFVICRLLNDLCEVIPHCSFDLHLKDYILAECFIIIKLNEIYKSHNSLMGVFKEVFERNP